MDRTRVCLKRSLLAVGLLILPTLLFAQSGPYAAPIQQALRSFVAGSQAVTGAWTFTTPNLGTPSVLVLDNATVTTPVGVTSLPTCNASNNLKLRIVTDALTPTIGGAVSSGGALRALVVCINGTGWIVL